MIYLYNVFSDVVAVALGSISGVIVPVIVIVFSVLMMVWCNVAVLKYLNHNENGIHENTIRTHLFEENEIKQKYLRHYKLRVSRFLPGNGFCINYCPDIVYWLQTIECFGRLRPEPEFEENPNQNKEIGRVELKPLNDRNNVERCLVCERAGKTNLYFK